MENKVEIPIIIKYSRGVSLRKLRDWTHKLEKVELAEGITLQYDYSGTKAFKTPPEVLFLKLVLIPFIVGYFGHRMYPYIDKAIDKLVDLFRQMSIEVIRIGKKKILVTQYSREELKQIIKEAIEEYIEISEKS